MPFTVIESSATHLYVALDTVVISPQIVLASFDFSSDGIAAKVEGSSQKHGKVQSTHAHCSEKHLWQKSVRHSGHGSPSRGLRDFLRGSYFEKVRHCSIVCAIHRLYHHILARFKRSNGYAIANNLVKRIWVCGIHSGQTAFAEIQQARQFGTEAIPQQNGGC